MNTSQAHRELAARLILQHKEKDFTPPDSLVAIAKFAFTEEEAIIINNIGFKPSSARAIARRVKRPLEEVQPVLDSLSERILIGAYPVMKIMHYVMLPLVPGIFEAHLLAARGKYSEYTREFCRLFEEFYRELADIVRPALDGKEVPVFRIIPVEQSLHAQPELNVLTYNTDIYSEIVDRNKSFALIDCPCRTTAELVGDPCSKPKDVCTGMGLIADVIISKGLAKRISKEEFLEVKARANEAGLVNAVDNLKDPLQVCSCCACHCVGLRLANIYNVPALIAKSHFESVINEEKCNGCKACEKWCPMYALKVDDGKCKIDYTKCIGCGICVNKCSKQAIYLQERKGYQRPPDDVVSHIIGRYMDIKGYNKNGILPRATLGMGRVLGKYIQPRFSGPDYKPPKDVI